ncbi:hypothetical protein [Belliella aquatica]|uniref:RagB/SusD family nutrient uptake outer membrane protein n=1 Tax=Belliella aquatica TaxID=1323734 RepID=A0ABQ1MXT6_9BACT|nr:hypothetical protein [Belliella aquatica]MCH7406533.1 hypothetical protein [Belliella aquatica]GGC46725.1 hypothetical protein GCM10010993_26710 [Belliella aquatica]
MKNNKLIFSFLLSLIMVFSSCEDLEVEDLNAASLADVYANPSDILSVVEGQYTLWWDGIQKNEPNMALSVTGEGISASWGNWGMFDLGAKPRLPFNNTLAYGNRFILTQPWIRNNQVLGAIREALFVLESEFGGQLIDPETNTDLTANVLANSKVLQGLALGWNALLFDQSYVADETLSEDELANIEFVPYPEVAAAAVQKFEEAAAIFESNPSAEISQIPGQVMSGAEAAAFCRNYAAMILAYSARTSAETEALDWAKIVSLTNTPMVKDFSPNGDGGFSWWSRLLIQGQLSLWSRMSQRIVNMMEGGTGGPTTVDTQTTTAPYPWPENTNTLPAITNPVDKRLNIYTVHVAGNTFQPARGYHFFSNRRSIRYVDYLLQYTGPIAHLTKNEMGLIRAEALVRTGGDKSAAVGFINDRRVSVGELAAVAASASNDQILDAIYYEHFVEHYLDGVAKPWMNRRRTTVERHGLIPGTVRQLPVPASELDLRGLPVYTFGGDN